jgi:CheY-like chemotaxis protein
MDARKIIMYVDDDADDREMVTDLIMKIDRTVEVVTVADGQEALDKLKVLHSLGHLPCLIILDMNMPRLDGRETLEEIRSIRNWDVIPICIYSTSARARYADIALKYEVDIIMKPTTVEGLDQSINQLLSHRK